MDLNKLENDINQKEKVKPMVGSKPRFIYSRRIFCNNCNFPMETPSKVLIIF